MNKKLIEILKTLMDQNGHNSLTLSEKSGVSQGTISNIQSGESEEPRLSIVRKLAGVYGLNGSQLRGDIPLDSLFNVQSKEDQDREYLIDIIIKGRLC